MILGQIAWVDCFAFLIFLAPALIIQVGLFETLICGLQALPFLLINLPLQFIKERFFTPKSQRSPFVRQATPFQDVVIRCVRYAFAKIPAAIGRTFFSKSVALPFFRIRMLRHGFFRSPIFWKELERNGIKGLYMVYDVDQRPDVVVYYCHGGGFSMGSAYFYIEFLLAWTALLRESAGFKNPAIFALDYTLVPQATYPTQVQQTLAGYKYVLSLVDNDSSKVCVSGDSAGATLILSLLLCLSDYSSIKTKQPGLAVVISPWATILSPKNKNTSSDYLNENSLCLYGNQYIGTKASPSDPLVSPGSCESLSWWKRASPKNGWYFLYGSEEVFAPVTRDLMGVLRKAGVRVDEHEELGWIHAWPVVKLFLCNKREERMSGLSRMVGIMKERMLNVKDTQ